MVKEIKKTTVSEIEELLVSKENLFFVDFSGLDANALVKFRKNIRSRGGVYKVFKNRLFKIAARNRSYPEEITDFTTDITGYVFSPEDPTGIAKFLESWSKENKTFQIKGGVYQNKVLKKEDVISLANIPSKEELVAKLLFVLNSPVIRFVNVLKANQRDLVLVLKGINDKK